MKKSPILSLCKSFVACANPEDDSTPLYCNMEMNEFFEHGNVENTDLKYKFDKGLFVFSSSRIYVMVNEINMASIFKNKKYILKNFVVSFLDFHTCVASVCDRKLFEVCDERATKDRIAVVRKSFEASSSFPMTQYYKKQLGKPLYESVVKEDLLICLAPIATLFEEQISEVKERREGVLGYDLGGFVVPKLTKRVVRGKVTATLKGK